MVSVFIEYLQSLGNTIPEDQRLWVSLAIYTVLIIFYSVFIWYFYKFLSKRDILELNLKKYNNASHPFLEKLLATSLFTLEYLIILPFLVFFWFGVFSIFLLLLSESQDVPPLLLISTAIISSIRVVAYINNSLAEDLAKILPFTLLVTFTLNFNLISLGEVFMRLYGIPQLLKIIFMYLGYILMTEFILRLFYSLYIFLHSNDDSVMR